MPRIAIAGFQHETNSFAPVPTGLEAFRIADSWPGLLRGDAVINGTAGLNLPIAGFAEGASRAGADLVPILWCAAEPAGPVTDHAFETVCGWILDGIRAAGPLDGIYLDLHGAMITASHADGEGAFLARLRDFAGPDIPVVVSLDLHANVSQQMVELADVLCIFRTYPHLDMAETGARAWARMSACLAGNRLARAVRRASFLLPLHAQHTDGPPASTLYQDLPDRADALVEMALGFTAAENPDRAPAIISHAATQAAADRLADAALARLEDVRNAFDTRLTGPDSAVRYAMDQTGPIVLADVQDNPGAGASADTTGLLRALVRNKAQGAILGLLHDPDVARKAHEIGAGGVFHAALGGRSGLADDSPFEGRFRVERLHDGECRYSGEMYGGGICHLGPSCVISVADPGVDIQIVVTSLRIQCLDLAQFTSFGLDPTRAQIVCVKSTAHFRAAFAPIAQEILPVEAPGLFPCSGLENGLQSPEAQNRAVAARLG